MKKVKIEIKTFAGTLLFKYESKGNTTKQTLEKAVETDANLRDEYLRDADLTGADLTGAYLRGAYLTGAYLTGADLDNIKIKKAAVFTGLYKYVVIPFISEKNEHYVTMGCYTRTIKEWDKDFWNNISEFPNDKSIDSQLRLLAYQTAKKWIKLMTKK